jgi:hypothetical protein
MDNHEKDTKSAAEGMKAAYAIYRETVGIKDDDDDDEGGVIECRELLLVYIEDENTDE